MDGVLVKDKDIGESGADEVQQSTENPAGG